MDGSVSILVLHEADVNVLEEKGTSGATCTMTRCTSVKFRVKTGCLVMDVKLWSAVGGLGCVVVWGLEKAARGDGESTNGSRRQ